MYARALGVQALNGVLGDAGRARVERDDDDAAVAATAQSDTAPKRRDDHAVPIGARVVVTADRDAMERSADGHGGWVDRMRWYAGAAGDVVGVDADGDCRVRFADGKAWMLNAAILEDVAATAAASSSSAARRPLRAGDSVRVCADRARCAALNAELGFEQPMYTYVGARGGVLVALDTLPPDDGRGGGTVVASVRHADGRSWAWNPLLLALDDDNGGEEEDERSAQRRRAADAAEARAATTPNRPSLHRQASPAPERLAWQRSLSETRRASKRTGGGTRPVRAEGPTRVGPETPETLAAAPLWEWEEAERGWVEFDAVASAQLESALPPRGGGPDGGGGGVVALTSPSGDERYRVDLAARLQAGRVRFVFPHLSGLRRHEHRGQPL